MAVEVKFVSILRCDTDPEFASLVAWLDTHGLRVIDGSILAREEVAVLREVRITYTTAPWAPLPTDW